MTNDNDGVAGYGVYFEFRQEANGLWSQFLMVGEMINPATGVVVNPTMLTRQVSDDHPQSRWLWNDDTKRTSNAVVGTQKSFIRTFSVNDAIVSSIEDIKFHLNSLDTVAVGAWAFYMHPLVVEISSDDAINIANYATPRALSERIVRLRTAEGFADLPKATS